MTEKYFVLVDGSSYLYRAFHAMPSLSNAKGHPTGAIYGIVNMLRRLLLDYDPEFIAVVFDAKGKTFRDDLYADYKATRAPMPNDLGKQIPDIHTIIAAMGLPILMIEGVEADDVIGTLAQASAKTGNKVLISTGDKDLAQLVTENITLVNTMTNTFLNPTSVKEKFGVAPELIIDYLALMGDSVDNIPGVPMVGPKTAVKWLSEYGSLDNIIKNAEKISGKVGENLRGSLAKLPLSKTLVTIKCDVELPVGHDDLRRKKPDTEKLLHLYQELGFKTWLAETLKENPAAAPKSTQTNYQTILSMEALHELTQQLSQSEKLVLTIETNNQNYMNAEIIGIAISTHASNAFYIPCNQQLPLQEVLSTLKKIFENSAIKKIGHNLKFVIEVLANYHINLQGVTYDTMLESYVVDSANNNHTMDSLTLKYLGTHKTPFEDIAGKGAKQISFQEIPLAQAAAYATEEADMILQVHSVLWEKLTTTENLKKVFQDIEMPLLEVLARVERNGVYIDANKLKQQSVEIEKRLQLLEAQCHTEAGTAFNINSPKQLQEILFNILKLPVLQKTPTGQPSTADPILQELALDYVLPKLIIEYRSLSKLLSTYTNRLPEQINPKTKRVHTSYNQTGAATGRLSSSDPNLQNIPVRTAEGRRIRQAFVAPSGFKIISADYSQIELRIMSHISNDEGLVNAFAQNLDIHQATAAEVLGLPLEEVTAEQRRSAKAINFGLIYGMSAFGLARQLGLERNAAQAYIDKYFARYPLVKEYMENTREKAHKQGFVETLMGRRLYLPEINSSQMMRRKAAERAAINAPLQGTAADIIKRAMISLDHYLQSHRTSIKMIMQVHDELVFEVAEADVEQAVMLIKEHMVQAGQLKVPLVVSVGIGDNWDSASAH